MEAAGAFPLFATPVTAYLCESASFPTIKSGAHAIYVQGGRSEGRAPPVARAAFLYLPSFARLSLPRNQQERLAVGHYLFTRRCFFSLFIFPDDDFTDVDPSRKSVGFFPRGKCVRLLRGARVKIEFHFPTGAALATYKLRYARSRTDVPVTSFPGNLLPNELIVPAVRVFIPFSFFSKHINYYLLFLKKNYLFFVILAKFSLNVQKTNLLNKINSITRRSVKRPSKWSVKMRAQRVTEKNDKFFH